MGSKSHSVKRYMVNLANRALARVNLKLSKVRSSVVSGVDLFPDLSALISHESAMCLDVGANEGQTIESLENHLVNPCIHAFEPSSSVFERLSTKGYSDRVSLYNFALGATQKQCEFINYQDPFLSSFYALDYSSENRFREVKEASREVVRIQTLDNFLMDQDITKVDLLKIDTQGFDLEVLLGGENALKKGVIRYVLVELNFVKMYQSQADPLDIIRLLAQSGIHLIDYYEKVRQNNTLAWCTALFGKR